MTGFVHLRVHSEYSLVDGLVRVRDLVTEVASRSMPAVGLSDRCNFFGLIKFYKAAMAAGVKPVLGADLEVVDTTEDASGSLLTLFAMDAGGYRNLTQLISRAYLEGQRLGRPRVVRGWLAEAADGLIALSGAHEGDVGQALLAGRDALAESRAREWMALYPDRYYLEVQRTGREYDEDHLHLAVALAERLDCPVVATNDVRFLRAEEFEAHEARVCIGEGRTLDDPRRPRRYSDQQYLRTAQEMAELFDDLPEALENTIAIARRCSVQLELGRPSLPEYPVPAGLSEDEYLRRVAHEGLDQRLAKFGAAAVAGDGDTAPGRGADHYRERLDFELDIIVSMGFAGYFLIVMDFIRWAKAQGIPVGPGRGSGAGSLVAYALEITNLDPLRYDLLFERFLNPDRVSMPDFDIDFCMERRDEVIDYVAERYGRAAVSQIITFGTMAAKAVVRDVARVQGKSYGLADKLSKMIPFEVGMTLAKAHEQEEGLREFLREDPEAQEIWDMAEQLEGITRNVGKHAGGVVIAPSRLTDFSPLYCDDAGGGLVTQYDKTDVEDAGLVKFDFLGLRTLTIIAWAVRMINEVRSAAGEEPLDIEAIPLDDEASYRLLQSAETTAVFQLESRGMRELIARARPDCFEDIVALVALYRPGPLQSGMVDNFIDRKHGREVISYPDPEYQHPSLKPILDPTYGIILYQEQVMQIAQELAGYSLGGADLLRRAMGKKKPEEMAKQRAVFARGAEERGIDSGLATRIFDLVEKFAGYGFNKSHSAAYALVSYQTAWLKAHHPAAFMAAVMSSELHNTDKIVVLVDECRRLGVDIRLPDVNEGEYMFSVNRSGQVVYGLGAIKGLGEGPVSDLMQARRESGPFLDLFDFCSRTDPRRMNRRAIEALIRAGAFDSLGTARSVLFAAVDDALRAAEQNAANRSSGMVDLFGEAAVSSDDGSGDPYGAARRARPWTDRERLRGERDTLGLYISGHPIEEVEEDLRHIAPVRLADVRANHRASQTVAGLVFAMRTMRSKRGTMAVLQLDDRSARLEVTVFPDTLLSCRDFLQKDQIVIVEGRVAQDDFNESLVMRATEVRSLAQERERRARELQLVVDGGPQEEEFDDFLEHTLRSAVGACPVTLLYRRAGAEARIRLGPDWAVRPSDELLRALRTRLGDDRVGLRYH